MDPLYATEPLTAREREYAMQEEHARATEAIEQIHTYRTLGIGLAGMVLGMWEGLEGSGLSREERLELINSALRGR